MNRTIPRGHKLTIKRPLLFVVAIKHPVGDQEEQEPFLREINFSCELTEWHGTEMGGGGQWKLTFLCIVPCGRPLTP